VLTPQVFAQDGLKQSGISVTTDGVVTLDGAASRKASPRKFDHVNEIAKKWMA